MLTLSRTEAFYRFIYSTFMMIVSVETLFSVCIMPPSRYRSWMNALFMILSGGFWIFGTISTISHSGVVLQIFEWLMIRYAIDIWNDLKKHHKTYGDFCTMFQVVILGVIFMMVSMYMNLLVVYNIALGYLQ